MMGQRRGLLRGAGALLLAALLKPVAALAAWNKAAFSSKTAADALKNNNQIFLDLAKSTLERERESALGDFERRQQSIAELVRPVQASLEKFDARIAEIEVARAGAYAAIAEQGDDRQVPEKEEKPRPTPEQIQSNKEKWGYTG